MWFVHLCLFHSDRLALMKSKIQVHIASVRTLYRACQLTPWRYVWENFIELISIYAIQIQSIHQQEYYQSDRPTPAHYRHSQSDLTEWDEQNHNARDPQQRRSGNTERDPHYAYRNGSREKEEWDENERARPNRYVWPLENENENAIKYDV